MNQDSIASPADPSAESPVEPAGSVPLPPAPAPAARPGAGDIATLLLGLLLVAGGLALGLLALLFSTSALPGRPRLARGEVVFTFVIAAELALALGVPLVAAGLAALSGPAPRRFALGPWWAWFGAWVVVVAGGQFALLAHVPRALAATIHVTGMTLPVVVLAAWLAPRLAARGVTWRGAWLHLVSGATLSVTVAIVLEFVGGAVLAVTIYAVALVLTPDAPARLQELVRLWNSGQITSTDALAHYVSWTPLVIFAVLTFSVLVPVIEELVKPLSVTIRLAVRRRELDPHTAFLLGALCGAGFALIEGPLNTTTSVGEGWWLVVLLRAGATLLHSFNAALTAWGWAQLLERRAWGRWLAALAGAVALHALWNGSTIVLVPASLSNESASTAISVVFFGALSLLSGAGLVVGARRSAPAGPSTA